jgi:hypothetical protein
MRGESFIILLPTVSRTSLLQLSQDTGNIELHMH